MREGAKLAAAGLTLGVVLALGSGRLVSSMLYQVSPYDPRAFGVVAVLLFATGMAAAFVPARRASRVDPMTALRSQ